MRLGVLDVGSNTVHLMVVDAHRGAHPWPCHTERTVLRLAEAIGADGLIAPASADALVAAVARARRSADAHGVTELLAFATAALRDAGNGPQLLARVREQTGVDLRVLAGEDEARATFLAARRWFGWSAGRLLVVDIGGGSLEIAAGGDEDPQLAVSLPLGAARLTRGYLDGGRPPPAESLAALRAHVAELLEPVATTLAGLRVDRAVGCSKTLRSLARLAGAAGAGAGPLVPRLLTADGLRQALAWIERTPTAELAERDGVSASRAHQLLAGAVIADTVLRRLTLDTLHQCPWALREGLILRRLDRT